MNKIKQMVFSILEYNLKLKETILKRNVTFNMKYTLRDSIVFGELNG